MIRYSILLLAYLFLCGFLPEAEEPRIVIPSHETAHVEAAEPASFSLAAWNIEWFPGRHPHATAEEIQNHQAQAAQIIRDISPSLLFACEVQSLEALKQLRLDYPFLACTDFKNTQNTDLPNLGLAFLSRLPWKEIWALDFSNLADTRDRPPRGILAGEFVLPSGDSSTVYGVHLKSNHGSAEITRLQRQRAIRYLEWDWERRRLDPKNDFIIVMGDFNVSENDPAFEEEKTLAMLKQRGFVSVFQNLYCTVGKKYPYGANDFDHIFVSAPFARCFAPLRAQIVSVPPDVSDHHVVMVSISTE